MQVLAPQLPQKMQAGPLADMQRKAQGLLVHNGQRWPWFWLLLHVRQVEAEAAAARKHDHLHQQVSRVCQVGSLSNAKLASGLVQHCSATAGFLDALDALVSILRMGWSWWTYGANPFMPLHLICVGLLKMLTASQTRLSSSFGLC